MANGARVTSRALRWPRPLRAIGSLSRADRLAIVLLVLLPLALYLPPLIAGHVVAPGDDVNQNLPLRVLSGQMIAAGRLPAWDPYIWSGTPLLAGWNAGALFPGTFLFSFLPLGLAWTLNLASAPLVAGLCTYALARRLACGPLAALVAALVFSYTGFMSGQLVHLGLAQGTALMPLVLLGVDLLGGQPERRRRAGAIALVGVALALTVLAGDPRAITSTAIAAALWALARLSWPRRDLPVREAPLPRREARLRIVVSLAFAVALGAALSALQWLPGITFLSNSQRSSAAFTFFGSGSITKPRLVLYALLPFVQGTNGNFGQPPFVGSYNLPEVTLGCGLLALAAALSFFVLYIRRVGGRIAGAPTEAEDGRHLGLLLLLGIVGVLLTLGSSIPLAHLTIHVPLFGGERLQNRNAVLFDLPLALFAGYFVEDLGQPGSELRQLLATPLRYVIPIPVVGGGALALYALLAPSALARHLNLAGDVIGELGPYLETALGLAGACGLVLLLVHRLSPVTGRYLVATLVLFEATLFSANSSFASAPTKSLAASTPLSSALSAYTGPTGRFALYNPGFQGAGANPNAITEVGETDNNLIQESPSVEGYGSIVNGTYQNETATHLLENLNRSALNDETFNTLDLRTLVTLSPYFGEPIAASAPIPLVSASGHILNDPSEDGIPPDYAGPWPISAGRPATFDLAAPRRVRRATIALDPGAGAPNEVQVEAVSTTGALISRVATVTDGTAEVDLAGFRTEYLRVIVNGAGHALIGGVVAVVTDPNTRLLLDGALQGELTPPHWSYAGTIGGTFSIWQNSETAGLAWLEAPGSTAPETEVRAPGSVQVDVNSTGAPEHAVVDTPKAAILVRSEGYSGGWTARLEPVGGGPSLLETAGRFGLVQAISIPAGDWLVTWRYAPTSLLLGLVGTSVGGALLLALFVYSRRPDEDEDRPPIAVSEGQTG